MPEYGSGPEDHAWYAGRLAPGARLEVWTDEARTDRVTQLKDPQGELYPDGVVVCDDLGRYRFDTVGTYEDLWISPVGSARTYRLRRADMGVRLGAVESTQAALVGQVDTLTGRVDVAAPQAAAAHQAATALQDSIGQPNGLTPLDDAGQVPVTYLSNAPSGVHYLDVTDHGAAGDGATDDTAALRAALAEAANLPGSTVYLPPGRTFVISGPLYVQQGTRILARGATVQRSGTGWMLINRDPTTEPTAGGYDGHGDILVEGGVWDANGSSVATGGYANTFSIGHGRNIVFRDLTIRDVPGNHAIELCGCENVTITGCRFEGLSQDGDRELSEAVQLDMMISSGHFGAFGPYDMTPCRNITVTGCWFGGTSDPGAGARPIAPWGRGVGSHSARIGRWHTNVLVEGNQFDGCVQWGVGAYNWKRSAITNNVIDGCGAGIWVRSVDEGDTNDTIDVDGNQTGGSQDSVDMIVAGNLVLNSAGANSGIRIQGEPTGRIRRAVVSHNIVRRTGGPQLGIRVEYAATCRIVGNIVSESGGSGLSTLVLDDCVISDNNVQAAGSAGLTVDLRPEGSNVTVTGNMVLDPQRHGIWLFGGTHYLVEGNSVMGASAGSDQADNGISIVDGANGVTLVSNRVRQRPDATNNPAWGLFIDSTALNVRRGDNDFTVSGVLGEVDDQQVTRWFAPTFTNGWGHPATGAWQTARYKKALDGRIYLEGLINGGTVGASAFTLPADMRPEADRSFLCLSGSGAPPSVCRVVITTAGEVIPHDTVSSFVSLELSFEAANI